MTSEPTCDTCGRPFRACIRALCYGPSYTMRERLTFAEVKARWPELATRFERKRRARLREEGRI
jgi:hypothetical protein